MAPLEKAYFAGQDALPDEDVRRAEVANFTTGPAEALRRFGWKGAAASCVGLKLTGDNRRIESGQFLTLGKPDSNKIEMEAKKIWPRAATNVTIIIKIDDMAMFQFPHGTLCSDFLPGDDVPHSFTLREVNQNPTAILDEEKAEYEIGDFCLRLVSTIKKSSAAKGPVTMKYAVLLFPLSKGETLGLSFNTESAAWPGLLVTEGTMPLLPEASTVWQCPIVPLILSGAPFSKHAFLPPEGALRRAVASIMGQGVLPETCNSASSLGKMWDRLTSNPNEFSQKAGPVSWPKPTAEPTPEKGK
jgi:hypothetical protein